MELVRQLVN